MHFPVMLYFVAFTVVHVALVFATGALRNLNHMYAQPGCRQLDRLLDLRRIPDRDRRRLGCRSATRPRADRPPFRQGQRPLRLTARSGTPRPRSREPIAAPAAIALGIGLVGAEAEHVALGRPHDRARSRQVERRRPGPLGRGRPRPDSRAALPFTRSAAAASSSATHGIVTDERPALGIRRAREVLEDAHAARADRGVGLPLAPGAARACREMRTPTSTPSRRAQPRREGARRGIRVDRQQQYRSRGRVRRVDAGSRGHDAQPVLDDARRVPVRGWRGTPRRARSPR